VPFATAERLDRKDTAMPLLVFLLLVVLIAQIGFWDTLAAILGGVAMILLFVLVLVAFIALAGVLIFRRLRG
jgi:hypothetical protein